MIRASSRLGSAAYAAAIHLLLSMGIAGLVAALVFGFWFPSPLRELVGGTELFWLVLGVDVVCGPLLTAVIFNPIKSRAELQRDLTLVAFIQLLALGYGLHALAYARPLAIVHEVDRFRVVTYADLDEGEAAAVPDWAQPWRLPDLRTIGLRAATTSDEKMSSVDSSLQGVEPSQRPSWWQDYALSKAQVLQRARPLHELFAKHPGEVMLLDAAMTSAAADIKPGETKESKALLWLPVVSRRATDWVVLVDPVSARLRGFVHVDGF